MIYQNIYFFNDEGKHITIRCENIYHDDIKKHLDKLISDNAYTQKYGVIYDDKYNWKLGE